MKKIENFNFALTSVVGEIGNNCFDHNLGKWTDEAGAYFDYGFEKKITWIVVSDRGQGIVKSLQNVLKSLRDPNEALKIAFNERITGRFPELRGNGLKYVKSTISAGPGRGLYFQTDGAKIILGDYGNLAEEQIRKIKEPNGPDGTFALVVWEKN